MRSVFCRAFLLAVCLCGMAPAARGVTLTAVNRGYFRSDGRHIAGNYNVSAGLFSSLRYRGFLIFDLSTLEGTLNSATLHLQPDAYVGPASIPLDFFDVSSTASQLGATYSTTAEKLNGIPIFNDLGGGNLYATQAFTAAQVNGVPSVALNAQALTDITTNFGGLFAVGLAAQGPTSGSDYLVRFGDDTVLTTMQLELDITPPPPVEDPPPSLSAPLPEPGSLWLCSILYPGWLQRRHAGKLER